jgi:hypothetical protein
MVPTSARVHGKPDSGRCGPEERHRWFCRPKAAAPITADVNGASGPVVVCFGTRPQVIKASALLAQLRAHGPTLAVDTGQHYDYELNALLYEQLGIARPDE